MYTEHKEQIQDEKKFKKLIEEIKKSPFNCNNSVISCNFVGGYRSLLNHLKAKCKFEIN